jgi:hypothetical protein
MGFWDFFRGSKKTSGSDAAVSEVIRRDSSQDEMPWRNFANVISFSAPYDDYATPAFQTVALEAFQLWFNNPIAARIIEIVTDFIIGDGFTIECDHPPTKEYLDSWAEDPSIQLNRNADQWCTDLLLIGEIGLLPEINDISGFTRYEPLDPTDIRKVYQKWGQPRAIFTSWAHDVLEVIYIDKDPTVGTYGYLRGDIIFGQINTTTLLSRGYSILRALRDWLQAYDSFLYNELSRALAMRKFILDILVKGADEKKIKEYEEKYADGPESIVSVIHNENEEWKMTTADLKAADASALGKMIMHQILAGAGIAEHWLAEGGDVNRATASEMAKPILRRLERYQAIYVLFLEQVITFARDQAILHGAIPGASIDNPECEVRVIADPIDPKDQQVQWDFFGKMVDALSSAQVAGMLQDTETRKIVTQFLSEVGIEADDLDKSVEKHLKIIHENYQEKINVQKSKRA